MAKIMVVEDDPPVRDMVRMALSGEGHEVAAVSTGTEALDLVFKFRPDLVLTDLAMPKMSGLGLCRWLREDAHTAFTPIIFFSARLSLQDKLACFEAGADDYITKPFELDELFARVEVQLRKLRERGITNALSGLPGGGVVERVLSALLKKETVKFAVLYVDLDNFKAYNDYYGFIRGNQVILLLAQILKAVIENTHELDFVGHIGGDDFVVITAASRAEEICRQIMSGFDRCIGELYDPVDRERGYIITKSRQGRTRQFPIISVSIGVVTNLQRKLDSIMQIGELSAEVKRAAKRIPGSSYYFDHRAK